MAARRTTTHEVAGIHADAPAETLLIKQFRFWMCGHATHESRYWGLAWSALACRLDSVTAKILFAEVHLFTRIVHERTMRQIEWLPDLGRCISRDEGLVLALVQASQVEEPFTEIAAASELLGTYKVEALVQSSRSLAKALGTRHLHLEPIESVTMLPSTRLSIARRVLH